MKHNFEKRLKDLEREQGTPVEYVLDWADLDEDYSKPPAPGVIRLKWYDERSDVP
jgi:hypothetical protein